MPYYMGYPSPYWQYYGYGGGRAYGSSNTYADAYDDGDDYADGYDDDSSYADAFGGGSMNASGYDSRAMGGQYAPGSIQSPSGVAESLPSNPVEELNYAFPGLRLLDEEAEKPKTGPLLPPPGSQFFDDLPRPGISRASSILAPLGSGWRPQSDAGHSVKAPSEKPPSEKPNSAASQKPAVPKTPRASRAPSVRPDTPPSQATYPPIDWADFGGFHTPRELTEVPRGLNEIMDSCNGLPDPDKILEYLREARRSGRNPLPLPDGLDMSFTGGRRRAR